MTDLDLARTALTTAIHHLGVAYRVQILSISQNEGLKLEDNYLDIKVYDNVISQIGNIQIGNVQSSNDSKENYNYIDDLPASILEDFPEALLDKRDSVANNLKNLEYNDQTGDFEYKGQTNDFEYKGQTDDGYQVFHFDLEQDNRFDLEQDNKEEKTTYDSDINKLNYDSLFRIFEGVLREMLAVTIFSAN